MRASSRKHSSKQQSKTGRRLRTAGICIGTGAVAAAATLGIGAATAGAAPAPVDLPISAAGVPTVTHMEPGDVLKVTNTIPSSSATKILGIPLSGSGKVATQIEGLTQKSFDLAPGESKYVRLDHPGDVQFKAAYRRTGVLSDLGGGNNLGDATGLVQVVKPGDNQPAESKPAEHPPIPVPDPQAGQKPAAPAAPKPAAPAAPALPAVPAVPQVAGVPGVPPVAVPSLPATVPLAGEAGESASPSGDSTPSAAAALPGDDSGSGTGIELPKTALASADDAMPASAQLQTPLLIAVVLLAMVSAGLIRMAVLRRHASAGMAMA